jgi:hypothetical protein
MLTTKHVASMYAQIVNGLDKENSQHVTDEESSAMWDKIAAEVTEMRAENPNIQFSIPNEMPDADDDAPESAPDEAAEPAPDDEGAEPPAPDEAAETDEADDGAETPAEDAADTAPEGSAEDDAQDDNPFAKKK